IREVPAVVFAERDVVYGTTDIQRAAALRAGSRPWSIGLLIHWPRC
ncbi:DUF1525 domain-containing protein, partial [Klebsiella pneumoniae]